MALCEIRWWLKQISEPLWKFQECSGKFRNSLDPPMYLYKFGSLSFQWRHKFAGGPKVTATNPALSLHIPVGLNFLFSNFESKTSPNTAKIENGLVLLIRYESPFSFFSASYLDNILIFARASLSWKLGCFHHTRWIIVGIHLNICFLNSSFVAAPLLLPYDHLV